MEGLHCLLLLALCASSGLNGEGKGGFTKGCVYNMVPTYSLQARGSPTARWRISHRITAQSYRAELCVHSSGRPWSGSIPGLLRAGSDYCVCGQATWGRSRRLLSFSPSKHQCLLRRTRGSRIPRISSRQHPCCGRIMDATSCQLTPGSLSTPCPPCPPCSGPRTHVWPNFSGTGGSMGIWSGCGFRRSDDKLKGQNKIRSQQKKKREGTDTIRGLLSPWPSTSCHLGHQWKLSGGTRLDCWPLRPSQFAEFPSRRAECLASRAHIQRASLAPPRGCRAPSSCPMIRC